MGRTCADGPDGAEAGRLQRLELYALSWFGSLLAYTAETAYPATAGAFAAPIVREGMTAHAGVYSFEDLGQAMPVKTYQQMSYGIDLEYRLDAQ